MLVQALYSYIGLRSKDKLIKKDFQYKYIINKCSNNNL